MQFIFQTHFAVQIREMFFKGSEAQSLKSGNITAVLERTQTFLMKGLTCIMVKKTLQFNIPIILNILALMVFMILYEVVLMVV